MKLGSEVNVCVKLKAAEKMRLCNVLKKSKALHRAYISNVYLYMYVYSAEQDSPIF